MIGYAAAAPALAVAVPQRLSPSRNGGLFPMPDPRRAGAARRTVTVSGLETRRAPPARRLDRGAGPCDATAAGPPPGGRTCFSPLGLALLGHGDGASQSRHRHASHDRHRQHQQPSARDQTGGRGRRHAGVSGEVAPAASGPTHARVGPVKGATATCRVGTSDRGAAVSPGVRIY